MHMRLIRIVMRRDTNICGFQDGIELSAKDVGEAVKKMHVNINSRIFSRKGLLRGCKISIEIESGISCLVDGISE